MNELLLLKTDICIEKLKEGKKNPSFLMEICKAIEIFESKTKTISIELLIRNFFSLRELITKKEFAVFKNTIFSDDLKWLESLYQTYKCDNEFNYIAYNGFSAFYEEQSHEAIEASYRIKVPCILLSVLYNHKERCFLLENGKSFSFLQNKTDSKWIFDVICPNSLVNQLCFLIKKLNSLHIEYEIIVHNEASIKELSQYKTFKVGFATNNVSSDLKHLNIDFVCMDIKHTCIESVKQIKELGFDAYSGIANTNTEKRYLKNLDVSHILTKYPV